MIGAAYRVEEIVVRRRADGSLAVLTTPLLSAITPQALAELPARYRPHPGVVEFAPHARYEIGAPQPRTGVLLLRRLP